MKDSLSVILHQYKKSLLVLGSLSLLFVMITSSVIQFQIEFQRASVFDLRQYTELPICQIFIYRYVLLICSLFISASLLIIVEYCAIIQRLSSFGQSTLFIYYVQTFMFAIIGVMSISLYQSLLITLITIPILTYISRWNVSKFFMNPICFLTKLI